MPELPEVETTKRGIQPHLQNQQILDVEIRQAQLRWPITAELVEQVSGQDVISLSRRGKYIGIHTSTGTVIIHLGMSGSLYLVAADTPPLFHDHVDFKLSSGQWLRYTDPRRFGAILWTKEDWLNHSLIQHLGPEPLSDAFNAAYLAAKAKGKTQAIKTFIMDSKQVVGVGNIYANEALFMAGIKPNRRAGLVSAKRLTVLVDCIKLVLAQAIEQGGTTLKDFVGGDGKPGYFKQSLNVYGRAGKPCLKCESSLVEIRLGQRSTVYCKECQK